MEMFKILILFFVLKVANCGDNFVDFTRDFLYVQPWETVLLGVSSNELTDKTKIQIWHVKTAMNAGLFMNCSSNTVETVDCDSSSVTVHVNGYTNGVSLCGQISNKEFGYTDDETTIVLKLSLQGKSSNEWLACNLVSHLKGPSDTYVTDPPQVHYKTINFVETDSLEHGIDTVTPKTTSCPCGRKNRQLRRIVGGQEYWPHKYPFIAGIVYSTNMEPFCGGAIITPKFVLTAAHCTNDVIKNSLSISVTAGEHSRHFEHINLNKQVREVADIKQHDDYAGPPTYENDISLLVLDQNLIFNEFVSPICLPNPDLDVTGQEATIIGWGAQIGEGPMTTLPAYVKVRIIDKLSCSADWELVSYRNPTQICTYAAGKSSCQGDSGGPVVWLDPETNRYTLIGLVSFGVTTCSDEKPAVHTDVMNFVVDIVNLARDISPGEQLCGKL